MLANKVVVFVCNRRTPLAPSAIQHRKRLAWLDRHLKALSATLLRVSALTPTRAYEATKTLASRRLWGRGERWPQHDGVMCGASFELKSTLFYRIYGWRRKFGVAEAALVLISLEASNWLEVRSVKIMITRCAPINLKTLDQFRWPMENWNNYDCHARWYVKTIRSTYFEQYFEEL